MVITIMTSDGIKNIPAGESLQSMFMFGIVIMTILIVIFMLYINSFLIKRRKREFGLYGILGLEKRHVGKVIVLENFLISFLSGLLGIISGCIIGKLVFMLIYYSLNVTPDSRYTLSIESFLFTGVLLIVLFLMTSIFNLLQVSLANPVDLLKSQNMGEKRVRFIKIKTISGLGLIIWAYYTALSVSNAITALNKFFIAVLAVIAATYLLFEAGSLFFLNFLKSRKKIYYKTNNFISISGMLHRMKQNAAGLSSICILSTMVLVTVSTCTALYMGQEDILKQMNPSDISINIYKAPNSEKIEEVEEFIKETALKYKVEFSEVYGYSRYQTVVLQKGSNISTMDDNIYGSIKELEENNHYIKSLEIITQEEYNKVLSKNVSLKEKEIVLLTSMKELGEKGNLNIPGGFQIKEIDRDNKLINKKNLVETEVIYMVVNNNESAMKLYSELSTNAKEEHKDGIVIANVSKEGKNIDGFSSELREKGILIDKVVRVNSIYTNRNEGYGVYGGLLFLGIFFAIQFLSATVLIIYFKQVSEGYDDSSRFIIMQNVGMDEKEVKRTINKQILLVFFLPLVAALLHVAFARQMIIKLLGVFSMFNTSLTTWCMIITSLGFTLSYIIFYKQTAKVYYKLVKR
ncbi:MAG: ABC-type antimicrobial peptide transport system, permease component [Anaerocolumna sp.]|nr:ABC-type antimicrobial peptide transport system, permease component [Anaerocolumna sp.]